METTEVESAFADGTVTFTLEDLGLVGSFATQSTSGTVVNQSKTDGEQRKSRRRNKKAKAGDQSAEDDDAAQFTAERQAELEHLVLGGKPDFSRPRENSTLPSKTAGKRLTETVEESNEMQPAWQDDDDCDSGRRVVLTRRKKFSAIRRKPMENSAKETVSAADYASRLRVEFERGQKSRPKWAQLSSNTRTNGIDVAGMEIATKATRGLPPHRLEFKKCGTLNRSSPMKTAAQIVEFHPAAQVAAVGGWDRSLALFQVDGNFNPLLQRFYFERFPLSDAEFVNSSGVGDQILVSSRLHSHLFYVDLTTSKVVQVAAERSALTNAAHGMWQRRIGIHSILASTSGNQLLALQCESGFVQLLSARSKEFVGALRMNGTVNDVAWHPRVATQLFTIGTEGVLYHWDVRGGSGGTCLGRANDCGSIDSTALAVSDQMLAIGSTSGVVNVYDLSKAVQTLSSSSTGAVVDLQPGKVVKNLTTKIDGLSFNVSTDCERNTELLAFWSGATKNGVRLLNCANAHSTEFSQMHVMENFPTINETIGQACRIRFSPIGSGYMTVGTQSGQAMLYRLKHYNTY